jgi:GNAT superfamily N-acetyltransferase
MERGTAAHAVGQKHLRRFALLDDRGPGSRPAKRYVWPIHFDGRDGAMCGLGAVFTRPDVRGHGYAGEIINQLVERSREHGAIVAGLFSEIGEDLYPRLGFVTVADRRSGRCRSNESTVRPPMLVRSGEERDLPALGARCTQRAARRALLAAARFVLSSNMRCRRSAAGWALGVGPGPRGSRQTEFFVAEEGRIRCRLRHPHRKCRMAGRWRRLGDRDPAGARLGAILQVLLAREPVTAEFR